MQITIERLAVEQVGVFGRLFIGDELFCATAEQPWRDNAKGRSCIPAGDYELRPWNSPKYGPVVLFANPALMIWPTEADVPSEHRGRGRALILIHNANWPRQLEGCVAVGKEIKAIPPHGLGVTSSLVTLAALSRRWGNRRGMTARVRWGCPQPVPAP